MRKRERKKRRSECVKPQLYVSMYVFGVGVRRRNCPVHKMNATFTGIKIKMAKEDGIL